MNRNYTNPRREQQIKIGHHTIPGDLDLDGFEADRPDKVRNDDFRLDRVDAAYLMVKTALVRDSLYDPQPGVGCDWLKSRVEERLGYFLYHGEFIMAMLSAGFNYKRMGKTCTFYIRADSIVKLRDISRLN